MSLPGVHIGFAATVTTLLVARSALPWRARWTIIGLSALWAVVPDLYWLVPAIEPWYKPLFHDSLLSNVFWFHGVIDDLDRWDRQDHSIGMLAVFLVVFSVTELWVHRPRSDAPRHHS